MIFYTGPETANYFHTSQVSYLLKNSFVVLHVSQCVKQLRNNDITLFPHSFSVYLYCHVTMFVQCGVTVYCISQLRDSTSLFKQTIHV